MCDGLMSLEVRVPFHNQLGSNLAMGQNGTTVTGVPITDTSFELDNVSIGFKALLRKTRSYAVSGGVALNLPTGRNVRIEGSVDTNSFYVDLPTLQPPYYAPAQFDFLGVVGNETVNLTPFLALSYNPDSIFFMQNFLQIDVPLNTSSADLAIQGTVGGIALGYPNNPGIYSVSMTEQALMRIDAQFGCWLYRNPCSNFINSIAGLFEVHYTGTLGDAKIARAPIVMGSMIGGVDGVDDINLTAGNIANRMDIVNFVFATAIQSGKTEVTPGFTVPISTGDNKPFDWEFALLLNRRF